MAGPAAEQEALHKQLEASNPELYRNLALYLQVLREVLPSQVEQACFHLVTQLRPSHYSELPQSERLQLHRRLQRLVRRCSSLLSVEQLAALAGQIQRERRRQSLQEHQRMLQQLRHSPSPAAAVSEDLPPGSVELSMALPLSPVFGSWTLPGASAAPPGEAPDPLHPNASLAAAQAFGEADRHAGEAFREGMAHPADTPADRDGDDPEDAALLRAMADACSTALVDALHDAARPSSAEEAASEARAAASGAAADQDADAGFRSGPIGPEAMGRLGRLPDHPLLLLRWLDGFDQALARRLRNLSHGLNVELRRCGITATLLPVTLLEAVLAGQLESQSGPANLLRLALPFGMGGPGSPETHGLLVRQADLEMEEPRLRSCRRRLQQHRLQVVKMAQQYRRLQRRLQVHQAERLWLQDIRSSEQQN